jgi:5-dehydro-2-deoxygluconokinase
MSHPPIDLVCLGRAAVDLYAEQIGARLEDVRTFAKYLGGSPCNTAVGAARLGLKAAMLTRVGDEHNGRFVRETLQAEGVDVSQVRTDPRRLTGLVFLGLRDRDTFPLIFYRDNCADMGLEEADVDPAFIASARGLLISGTHLSRPNTHAACLAAMRAARAAGTRVVLDIDYRPVLWGLTGLGLGEQRFVESARVSEHLQAVLPLCDLVVGTEEEIHIAGGSTDTLSALRAIRARTPALITLKRGAQGCAVFPGEIPASLDDAEGGAGFDVEVFNVLGAGDAFMAGFLRGWLRGEALATCCTWANAGGALVVSRHGCAPAMPSWPEMQRFVREGASARRVREDRDLEHLHRATTRTARWPELVVLAFDHRSQLEEIAQRHGQAGEAVARFKSLIAEAAWRVGEGRQGAGVIVDGRFGEDVLPRVTGVGLWVARPVEEPGSRPLRFECGGNLGLELRSWPAEQVAKCLVSYHPDDPPGLRAKQIAALHELQEAAAATGRELLVEVIPPRTLPQDGRTIARALAHLYEAGIRPDWWKLPPCGSGHEWQAIAGLIETVDPQCRGVLMLGLGASTEELEHAFEVAAPHRICRGFAVGRSLFADAADRWFRGELADQGVVEQVAARYAGLIRSWDKARRLETT